ncbi:MAG: extracellular solute-binding protein, partial [Chloroflexota bacterium]
MTKTPEIAFAFFGDTVARRSIRDAEVDTFIFQPELSEETQALIDTAIANAISESDLSYFNYIDSIIFEASEDDTIDIATALEEKQQEVIELLTAIDDATATTTIAVATAIPTPILQSGEIALTFGAEQSFGPLADTELWNAAIDEFVAQDSQVGQIIFRSEFLSLNERIETQDCFYLGSNIVPGADLTQLLSVDPFLSTDPNINPANFIPNTLDQLSREGATWGIPLSLIPNAIWYDRALFEEAGLPEPSPDWTMSEFIDTLNALTTVTDGAPFRSQSFGGQYIYQLVAAYGGQPIDYSTTPYTFQLEDPVTIEAIRQVLDLAKDELIDYSALATTSFGGGGGASPAVFDSFLSNNDFRLQNREGGFNDQRVTMFPRGVDTIPVAYQLGSGYISANSPAPDACYRWLSFLSTRTELLTGMPAQSDLFSVATENITEGEDVAAFYQAFNEALSSPNVVVLPIGVGGSEDPAVSATNFITQNWINGAFDAYVLEDADLQTALSQAQAFRDDYAVCAESIAEPSMPLEEMSNDEAQTYFQQFFQCAVDVDPSAAELYSFILDSDDDE